MVGWSRRAREARAEKEENCSPKAMRPIHKDFYIVMKSPQGSDYALFWRANREGYTRILDEAGRYSREEAERICKLRGEEFMVSCDGVEQMAVRLVDHSDLVEKRKSE